MLEANNNGRFENKFRGYMDKVVGLAVVEVF